MLQPKNIFVAVCMVASLAVVMLSQRADVQPQAEKTVPGQLAPTTAPVLDAAAAAEIEKQQIQIIRIVAKDGYTPAQVHAQAGKALRIEVETSDTKDCSLALDIPAIGYSTSLPSTGITRIEVPPQASGSMLTGVCSMGMYKFDISFK